MYLDIEAALVAWLPTVVTVRAVTELPADLDAAIAASGGVARINRLGGPDPTPSLSLDTVDVESFAATRAAARALALEVQYALRFSLAGHLTGGGSISRVQTVSGPAWRPYDDTNVRRFGALYQITTHSA
jgi:hypothetical protein